MPLYEFECLDCSFEFEALVRKASEKTEVQCPACKSLKLEEKISCFASGPRPGNCAPSGG
jgi:putative FmdB family regulatory protein